MKTTKTEALAVALEDIQGLTSVDGTTVDKAAAELRRLDSELERLTTEQAAQPEAVQEPVAWVWNPAKEAWEQVRAFGHWQQGAIYAFGPTPPAAPVQSCNLAEDGVCESVECNCTTQPAATCTWTKSPDPSTPDTFSATCGAMWTFTEGGPTDNDMHFCPKCGSKVVEGGAA